jgi:hypothetical protein
VMWEPMRPAPPVTRARLLCEVIRGDGTGFGE